MGCPFIQLGMVQPSVPNELSLHNSTKMYQVYPSIATPKAFVGCRTVCSCSRFCFGVCGACGCPQSGEFCWFSISLFCHIPIIPILFRLFRLQKSPCAFASIQGLYMLALTVALSVFLYQLGRRQTMKQLEAQWNSASRNFQNLPDNFKTVGN